MISSCRQSLLQKRVCISVWSLKRRREHAVFSFFFSSHHQKNDEKSDEDVVSHWLEQLKSIPNIITISRIASTPLLAYLIISEQHTAALIGCCVAGVSDVADGFLAKRYDMGTVLGTYLDPLADKILINVLAVSLCYTGSLPTPLVALWMTRDVALTGASYWYVKQNTRKGKPVMDPLTTPLKINPTNTSKLNTALQFATLSTAIINPIYPLDDLLWTLCWATGATTCASGFSYLDFSAFRQSGNKDK